jgi:reverse gyrase
VCLHVLVVTCGSIVQSCHTCSSFFSKARLCEGNGLESCLDESAEAGEAMSSIVDVAAGIFELFVSSVE